MGVGKLTGHGKSRVGVFDEITHVEMEGIDGLEGKHKTGLAVEGTESGDEIVLKGGVNGSAACVWTDGDGAAQASQVREHGGSESPLWTEQTIAQGGEDGAVSAPSFLFIINDAGPFVGIKANASTFIADAEGIFSRTGSHFHEHLPVVF